ncbi:MAG: branched-chain-amino-acid transaminase [Candidatus Omnitrophota bacterium]
MMALKIFFNGKFVSEEDAKISVFDHGVLYGDGVFEGIRSYKRKVFRLDEHLDRLYSSAEVIRLKIPITKDAFRSRILETLTMNDLDDAYVRAVVTRGPGDLGLDPRKCPSPTIFIIADKIALYPEALYKKGMPITIAKTRRNHPSAMNPRVKSLNYLNNIFGKIDAIDAGTEEALMLSVEGYIVECTGDNIFFVKDGVLMTPPCDIGSLEGITQKAVMGLARKRGIEAKFAKIKPEEIPTMDECFLTGTAAEIIPVIKIDDKTVGLGSPGSVTKQLLQDYKELIKKEGTAY